MPTVESERELVKVRLEMVEFDRTLMSSE